MSSLPGGTVTFLLSDIEDSSSQWEADADDMRAALAVHDELIARCVDQHGGAIVKHMGDGCWAAFPSAPDAADAAVAFRRHLLDHPPQLQQLLRVRIGLHTGDVDPTDDDYFGPVPNRTARVANLANGNQIVCSSATAGLLGHLDLRSAGLHVLKGIGAEEIFLLDTPGLTTDTRPLRLPVVTSHVPRVHTSFLGRDDEMKRVLDLAADGHSTITLTGAGGVGKTRLALEVGHRLADGTTTVVFVDLAVVDDETAVFDTVAEAVGARSQSGMDLIASIVDHLQGRSVVLILDNCEHVIEPARTLVRRLGDVDQSVVLATSREALRIPGEQTVPIEPLAVGADGIELFISRAGERDPDFTVADGDRDAIAAIVARLDGIPLAIELAAARIRLMTPTEMAEHLDDGFRLVGGSSAGGDRHATLHAAVSWSHRLLSAPEAELFSRLAVFNGGFDLAGVEAVCGDVSAGDVADMVLALVDKSMVASRVHGGRTRFALLETMRAFALEALADAGEVEEFRRRHARHVTSMVEREAARLWSPAEGQAWDAIDREWANIRTAIDSSVAQQDLATAAEIVIGLAWYATAAMREELFGWAEELLGVPGADELDRFTDLCGAAALGAYLTISGDPSEWAERGLAADPTDPESLCHTALAAVLLNNLHTAEASDALTAQWLAATPTTIGGRMWAEAFRTFHLCSHDPGPAARHHAAAVQAIADETGSPTARAMAAWAQGQVVSFHDLDRAIAIWEEGLEWPHSLPGNHLAEHLLNGLVLHVTVRRADLLSVIERCSGALRAAVDSHYHVGSSHLLGVAAIALCRADDAESGARLVGAMIGNGHIPRSNATRALADALGDDVDEHVTPGMALGITDACQLALARLADAADRLGG